MSKKKRYVAEDLGSYPLKADELIEEIKKFAEKYGVEFNQVNVSVDSYTDYDDHRVWLELGAWV